MSCPALRRRLFVAVLLGVLGCSAAFRIPWLRKETRKAEQKAVVVEEALKAVGKTLASYVTNEEKAMRIGIIESNLARIEAHNADSRAPYTLGVNQFIDMTDEEVRRYRGVSSSLLRHQAKQTQGLEVPVDDGALSTSSSSTSTSSSSSSSDLKEAVDEVTGAVLDAAAAAALLMSLPKRVDWRDHGVVTPVKSQGGCGSCWSFAAAEAIESAHAIATGELVVLSEQNILDCAPNPMRCGGKGGCTGATPELAFAMMQMIGGISSEVQYPYESGNGTDNLPCRFDPVETPIAAEVSGYVKLPPNDYARVMHALATVGPLAVNVDAQKFYMYKGGIFDACENSSTSDIDHAVVLVGYGTDEITGLDYWLLRNSWSAVWGESGYMRLKRTKELHCYEDPTPDDGSQCEAVPGPVQSLRVCGDCGVLFDVSYPLVLRPTPDGIRQSEDRIVQLATTAAEAVGVSVGAVTGLTEVTSVTQSA